jgi:excinuclease ABC subunit B
MFTLKSSFKPTGDQPQAIEKLITGVKSGLKNQVLLGVTGSGKTFTMANLIEKLQMPALVISHNKTLAGQVYQEMRDFFPENAVSYFVSYYDYYQPESYIPTTDTYIEKEADINQLIDKLRLQATTNILSRPDAIVVASVSCIYNIGSPTEYGGYTLEVNLGDKSDWPSLTRRLVGMQYDRSEFDFVRGSFRIRGSYMDIYPAYEDFSYRLTADQNQKISKIEQFDPLTGKEIRNPQSAINKKIIIYPAKQYMMNQEAFAPAEAQIRNDLKKEHDQLVKKNKLVEAQRLAQRVNYEL